MASTPTSLQGSLLLAAPLLRDPNFDRSVLFLTEHSARQGALGFVLNRPTDQVVSDMVRVKSMGDLASVPVYVGGPVGMDKLCFASLYWSNWEGVLHCETNLTIDQARHELAIGHDVRAFVGYSGWQRGQLEKELKTKSWIITEPQELVLTSPGGQIMWTDVLTAMGPLYSLIATMPREPELN
jgi:putative transcriptional regulator